MLLLNRYEYNPRTDLIGKGVVSRVYRAIDKQGGGTVAIKLCRKNNDDVSGRELTESDDNYSLIREPHIIQQLEKQLIEKEDAFGETEQFEVTITEMAAGGTARQYYLQHNDEETLHKIIFGLIDAVNILHDKGLSPLNIKPSNILITTTAVDFAVKLTDIHTALNHYSSDIFVSARLVEQYCYNAPESFSAGITADQQSAIASDFWKLGVTIYEIITGKILYKTSDTDTFDDIRQSILTRLDEEKINVIGEPYQAIIRNCLQLDPQKRTPRIDTDKTAEADTTVINKEDSSITTVINPVTVAENEYDTEVVSNDSNKNESDTVAFSKTEGTELKKRMDIKVAVTTTDDTQVINDSAQKDEADTQFLTAPEIPTSNADDTAVINSNTEKPTAATANSTSVRVIREGAVTLFNRYEYLPVSDLIGRGGFSRVYRAYDKKLSRWIALKVYKTNDLSDRYSPFAEIKRVINLDHSNICRYLDIEEMENVNSVGEREKIQICVMELLDGGNIAEYYKKNQEPAILKKLLMDVLNGIAYLHKKGIIHRDIKPANILIKETIEGPVAKITDFGISKASDSINNNSSSALIVSIPFMAPEQFNTKKYGINEKISYNLDLWSLGVTIYEVYTGKVLFKENEQDNSEQIMANIMAPELPDKIQALPQPFKNVVARCLVKNANQRVQKAEELLELLNENEGLKRGVFFDPTKHAGNGHKGEETTDGDTRVLTQKIPHIDPAPTGRTKISFSLDSDITTPVKKESKKRRNLILIIPAVLLLGVYFIFFNKFMADNAIENTALPTDSLHKKNVTAPPAKDTAKQVPIPVDTLTARADTQVTNNIPKQPDAKKTNEAKRTDRNTSSKKINSANKLVVELSANEACIVSSNDNVIGELNEGEIMKVYFPEGKHKISAVAKSSPNRTYIKIYTVLKRDLNRSSELSIILR